MNRRIGAALLIALVLSLSLFGIASAHAKLVSSDPAAGAKLDKAPAKVTLVFSEEISDKATDSFFTVSNAGGAEVGKGQLDNTDLDHKTLSGALKSGLADGVYTVTWQTITSDDNGKSEGSFKFGVNQDPGAQPTETPHDEAAPTAAAGAAAPTAAAGAAAPTAAASHEDAAHSHDDAPGTLPKTGDAGPDLSAYMLAGAAILLAGGLALRRGKRGTR
jgi:methionine-rich copper-binding protein CopC